MARQVLTYPDIPPVLTQTQANALFVKLAGDTMTGPLVMTAASVAGKPIAVSPDANNTFEWRANGFYAAAGSGGGAGTYVRIIGDTMTGALGVNPSVGGSSAINVGSSPLITGWETTAKAIQIGTVSTLYDIVGYSQWGNNNYNASGADKAISGSVAGSKMYQQAGALTWANCAIVAAGATQSMVIRFNINGNGTMTLTTVPGAPSLVTGSYFGAFFGGGTAAAFNVNYPGIQIAASTLWSNGTSPAAYWSSNSYYDGNRKAIYAGVGSELAHESGGLIFRTFASVGAGAVQTITQRFSIGSDGLVTIASGQQNSLTWASGYGYLRTSNAAAGHAQIYGAGYLMLEAAGNYVLPERGNAINLGSDANYWGTTFTRELRIMAGVNIQSINYQGLWDCIRDGADHVRFRRLGSGATWMRMIYSLAGVWFDEGITTPTINGSGALTLISPTDVTVNPASGVFVPAGDNAKACGWTTARWSTVHAANGSIQTSHVSQKKDFAPLDMTACVEAVLETDWLSYNYIDPNPPAPLPIAENESSEARGQRLAFDAEARVSYQKMVADTAYTRKQKGYVLGSDQYNTSELFGLSDRRSANTQADLAVVANALKQALQRIAVLEGKAAS